MSITAWRTGYEQMSTAKLRRILRAGKGLRRVGGIGPDARSRKIRNILWDVLRQRRHAAR